VPARSAGLCSAKAEPERPLDIAAPCFEARPSAEQLRMTIQREAAAYRPQRHPPYVVRRRDRPDDGRRITEPAEPIRDPSALVSRQTATDREWVGAQPESFRSLYDIGSRPLSEQALPPTHWRHEDLVPALVVPACMTPQRGPLVATRAGLMNGTRLNF
jgi:hypothetical protein